MSGFWCTTIDGHMVDSTEFAGLEACSIAPLHSLIQVQGQLPARFPGTEQTADRAGQRPHFLHILWIDVWKG